MPHNLFTYWINYGLDSEDCGLDSEDYDEHQRNRSIRVILPVIVHR